MISVRVVAFSRFESFVVSPGCKIQDLKGCFFGFGREAVHSYNVVGIAKCFCCWIENSVFSSGEIGGSGSKGCVFDCPFCFSVVSAYFILSSQEKSCHGFLNMPLFRKGKVYPV